MIHKTWCHACQNLKKTFAKAKAIQDLSKNFIMVNCEVLENFIGSKFPLLEMLSLRMMKNHGKKITHRMGENISRGSYLLVKLNYSFKYCII